MFGVQRWFAWVLGACMVAPTASAQSDIKFNLGLGVTFGGETIGGWSTSSGTQELTLGGEVLMSLGADIGHFPVDATSTIISIGWQSATVSGSNGSDEFSRVPIEGLVLYSFGENIRAGAGVQYVMSPTHECGIVIGGSDACVPYYEYNKAEFAPAIGVVLHAEYILRSLPQYDLSIGLRYASMGYEYAKVDGVSVIPLATLDGSYVGVTFGFIFPKASTGPARTGLEQ